MLAVNTMENPLDLQPFMGKANFMDYKLNLCICLYSICDKGLVCKAQSVMQLRQSHGKIATWSGFLQQVS
jgi:hypothetical protein